MLERLLSGHCSPAESEQWERHLDTCEVCTLRLAHLAGPLVPPHALSRPADPELNAPLLRMLIAAANAPPTLLPMSAALNSPPQGLPQAPIGLPGFSQLTFVGRGGSGMVYRARQDALGRDVAVKLLFAEHSHRGSAHAQHEAQVVAGLNHPHVITLYEAQLLHEPPYLVMEWIAGGSLHDRLRHGPLSIPEATLLACQLAEGVAAFHARGIVHRDLKPANVLLGADSRTSSTSTNPFCAKITDFGLARAIDAPSVASQNGAAVGTPSFMAPEQTGLRPEFGVVWQASDIYGVGAVLFAALTGRPPHAGETPLATLLSVAWQEAPWTPTLRPEIPIDLATIVAKCLRQDPGQRYRTAQDLADDLHRFREGQPIEARAYSPSERLRNSIRRHPTWAASLALGVAVLVAGLCGVGYHFVRISNSVEELTRERVRTKQALDEARDAMAAEQRQREHAVRQANMTHHVLNLPFKKKDQPDPNDLALMNTIRSFYHEQLRDPATLPADLLEVLTEGLLNCCLQELELFGRAELILADTSLALELLQRLPDKPSVRLRHGEALLLRFQIQRRQPDGAETQTTLQELVRVLESYDGWNDPPQLSHLQSCVATLWNTGHPELALRLVSHTLQRGPTEQAPLARSPETWSYWLSLQASEAGLRHQLAQWDAAADSLFQWRRRADQCTAQYPDHDLIIATQWLRLIAQHVQQAHRHQSPVVVRHWLAEGRAASIRLRPAATSRRDTHLALVEWVLVLSKLPPDLVPAEQVEMLAADVLRHDRTTTTKPPAGLLCRSLAQLALSQGNQALESQRFADALQLSREALAALNGLTAAAGSESERLRRQSCELAARACGELHLPAEQLSHLSHAASLAREDDRTRLDGEVRQLLQELASTAEFARSDSEEPPASR